MRPQTSISFHFTSTVDASYHDQLEALFYFHPDQSRYYDQIVETVDNYGKPVIYQDEGRLTIRLDQTESAQCLFAFYGPKLAAVLLYDIGESRLLVIHVAIEPDFLMKENASPLNMMWMLIRHAVDCCGDESLQAVEIAYKNSDLPITLFS